MIGQKKGLPAFVRLAIGVTLVPLGIAFPFFLYLTVLGGAIIWSVIAEFRTPADRSDNLLNHAYDATAQDVDWKERYLALCESPAESAFLLQMIAAFHLAPSKGLLVGDGIKVELQAEKLKYRLDFLVNAHHGIEVDGAQYHSDEYDRSKDAFRDAELSRHGIKVLRLPAKLVFNGTDEVIRRVREFLRDPTPAAAMPLPARPKTQGEQLMGARKKDPAPVVAKTLPERFRAGEEQRRGRLQILEVERERMERIEKQREEQHREDQRRGRLAKESDEKPPFGDLPF